MNTKPSEATPPVPSDIASSSSSAANPAAGALEPTDESVAVPAQVAATAATAAATTAANSPAANPGLRGRVQEVVRRDTSLDAGDDLPPETSAMLASAQNSDTGRGPVRPPSVREPLSPELERELEAALGNASLDDILAGTTSPQSGAALEPESRHRGVVARIHGDNVFFALGGRHEGVASLRQFPQPPVLGADMDVVVRTYSEEDGLYELLVPGASAHVEDWSDLVEGSTVEARITGANTGGLECKVGSIRGFIPASQVAVFRIEDYAEFLDQKLLCVVTEVNPRRKNLVLSRRAVLEREKEEVRQQKLASLEVGQIAEGVVRKLMDFGAFVDIGGIDGLVHVSQLSWDHVKHPSEVLKEGQKIRVKVEKIDPQTGKIGLSHRELLDHPWHDIQQKIQVESVINGTVSRIAKFGAFVKLAPGIEGLVHISELSHSRVPNVGSVVKEGQEVQVKVLSVDEESQRIALSMKAVIPVPVVEESAGEETVVENEPPREQLIPKRHEPLRGGTDRASGGDHFGLKW
jgi:small subunit ribosomal protein S1